MDNVTHTPGPWVISPCGDILGNRDTDTDNGLVCTMCEDRKDAEGKANARLIAAAPELLSALKGLVAFAEAAETKILVGDEGCLWPVEEARAAIAKAEGRA